jgi:hypothetical protein
MRPVLLSIPKVSELDTYSLLEPIARYLNQGSQFPLFTGFEFAEIGAGMEAGTKKILPRCDYETELETGDPDPFQW